MDSLSSAELQKIREILKQEYTLIKQETSFSTILDSSFDTVNSKLYNKILRTKLATSNGYMYLIHSDRIQVVKNVPDDWDIKLNDIYLTILFKYFE